MGDAARKLLDEALGLPDDERELLAVDLLASLESRNPEWERAWATEIEKRLREIQSGSVKAIPWEDVHASLLSRLGSR
jgi:putative addiction module component (TIGR02574 family)